MPLLLSAAFPPLFPLSSNPPLWTHPKVKSTQENTCNKQGLLHGSIHIFVCCQKIPSQHHTLSSALMNNGFWMQNFLRDYGASAGMSSDNRKKMTTKTKNNITYNKPQR